MLACAYRSLTADQLVNEGPTLLVGCQLHASADGGTADIYDGLDTLSGAHVFDLTGWANDPNPIMFTIPVLLNNGLYVDVGANVHHVTVYYIPLRGASPLSAYPAFMLKDFGE